MRTKIVLTVFVLAFCGLTLVNPNNSSYADINSGKSAMASEIEVIPDSLVLNIPAAKNKTKSERRQVSGPLTVNLDTLWDREDYWKDILPGRVIIRYVKSIDIHTAKSADLGLTDKSITIVNKGLEPLNFIVVEVPGTLSDMKSFMKLMKDKPYIECIEPDREMHISFTPNDTYYGGYQWDKPNINCPAAWDLGLGSMNVTIAIVDEGVEYAHQDLQARFTSTKGYDFFSGDADPKAEDVAEAHGTHCAGVAAASINNGLGIAGVSNSHLYSVRIGDKSGSFSSANCASAIQWCANNGINIVSMSWGNTVLVAEIDNACRHADSVGCLLVSATGNAGTNPMNYPAKLPQVMAVGAIDSTNQRWASSNYGPETELTAPGVNITSTIPFGQYQSGWNGTSEACPQVSGAAALIWSANPNLKNYEVRGILDSTATDLGTAGRDQYYGYGKPNVFAAVQKALEMSGPRDTGTININNKASASSNLIVSSITKSQNWILSISPSSFGVAPGGTKQVTIIAGGTFSAGTYRDTLKINSNDPTYPVFPVPVILQVGIGVEDNRIMVDNLSLKAFEPSRNRISIQYAIPMVSNLRLSIYDAAGRAIKNLLSGNKEAGIYSMDVNANNLSAGVYFVVLSADNRQLSEKVIIIR